MTKLTKLTTAILAIWLAIVALSATLSFVTASTKPTEDLQLMVDASTLNKQCQQAIKQYKIDHGYDTYPLLDKFDTGMLGIPSTIQFRDYYSTLYGKENVSKVYLEQAMPFIEKGKPVFIEQTLPNLLSPSPYNQ